MLYLFIVDTPIALKHPLNGFYSYYLSCAFSIAVSGIIDKNLPCTPLWVDVHLSHTFLPKLRMIIIYNEIKKSSDVLYNISETQGYFNLVPTITRR